MTGKTGATFLKVLLTASLLAFASVTFAQEKPADDTQLILEKVKADKKLLVSQNMKLTEAEAKKFWPVYDTYQDELFLLRARTGNLIKEYADSYEAMKNATAQRLLDEYMTIETLRLKLRQAYLPKFRAVLPPVKVLRYFQIENKIGLAVDNEIASYIPLAR